MSDGAMIIIIFACIIIIPLAVVFIVLGINKSRRRNKYLKYKGVTEGRVLKIVDKGLDYPWVIYVRYNVRDVEYTIKETANTVKYNVIVRNETKETDYECTERFKGTGFFHFASGTVRITYAGGYGS